MNDIKVVNTTHKNILMIQAASLKPSFVTNSTLMFNYITSHLNVSKLNDIRFINNDEWFFEDRFECEDYLNKVLPIVAKIFDVEIIESLHSNFDEVIKDLIKVTGGNPDAWNGVRQSLLV